MNEQVYGVFSSIENAEQAISALKDHGVGGAEISVVHRSDGTGMPQVENMADHGITPTSAEDVVAGAAKGGAVGLALGILGSAVMLTIPGIGPILAAGPLWAALGTTVMSTAAGVLGGGVVGFLVDQGLPADAAARYNDALHKGDILVSVRSIHVSTADARMILDKYGATNVEVHRVGEAVGSNPLDLDPPVIDRAAEVNAVPASATLVQETPAVVRPVTATPVVPTTTTEVMTSRVYDAPTAAASPESAATGAVPPVHPTGRATDPDVDLSDEPRQPVPPQAARAGLREIDPGTNRG
jgi:hypothetical protein